MRLMYISSYRDQGGKEAVLHRQAPATPGRPSWHSAGCVFSRWEARLCCPDLCPGLCALCPCVCCIKAGRGALSALPGLFPVTAHRDMLLCMRLLFCWI